MDLGGQTSINSVGNKPLCYFTTFKADALIEQWLALQKNITVAVKSVHAAKMANTAKAIPLTAKNGSRSKPASEGEYQVNCICFNFEIDFLAYQERSPPIAIREQLRGFGVLGKGNFRPSCQGLEEGN